jgi:predicted HTH transcriptional regulator
MGTGTGDIIQQCAEAGLPDPEFKLIDGFVTTLWRKTRSIHVAPKL